MRVLIYLSLLCLVACSDEEAMKAAKAAEQAKIAEAARIAEASKQTKLMLEEMDLVFNTIKTEEKANKKLEEIYQRSYLKLDILPEKYPQADSEAIAVVKEARVLFEFVYDIMREYASASKLELFMKLLSHSAVALTSKGKSLPEALGSLSQELTGKQKEFAERTNKLQFHLDQLEINMCNKYQIRCKTKS